jgi:hypothetical protein
MTHRHRAVPITRSGDVVTHDVELRSRDPNARLPRNDWEATANSLRAGVVIAGIRAGVAVRDVTHRTSNLSAPQ